MSERKQQFIQNIKNYVERGDCGHEGLGYQFEDSDGILYFANKTTEDYPEKTNSEMYVNFRNKVKPDHIEFDFIIPGKYRDVTYSPVKQFIDYIY